MKMAALGMAPTRPLAMVFENAACATSSNGMTFMRAYQFGIKDLLRHLVLLQLIRIRIVPFLAICCFDPMQSADG
ncbi:MAG: hypothetical protein ACKPKO_06150, partial [Candidatus Fonsibacter sp.]